jgi:hypothetical protein
LLCTVVSTITRSNSAFLTAHVHCGLEGGLEQLLDASLVWLAPKAADLRGSYGRRGSKYTSCTRRSTSDRPALAVAMREHRCQRGVNLVPRHARGQDRQRMLQVNHPVQSGAKRSRP